MPKPVEEGLRSRTKEFYPYKKRWHKKLGPPRWYKIPINNQKTFAVLQETIRWLAETVSTNT
jgi:hypothetical protein